MKFRRLDKNSDADEAILLNCKTRLMSFRNDWFLDQNQNIDWFTILGQKNNEETIINEVERVCLNSEGIVNVVSIDIVKSTNRSASIEIVVNTIFSEALKLGVEI
jgi:hypothetical protein